jgi:hypothetical protein
LDDDSKSGVACRYIKTGMMATTTLHENIQKNQATLSSLFVVPCGFRAHT